MAAFWLIAADAALAQPVGQQASRLGSPTLNSALARLARDPRDLGALIDAGNAALQMGDVDAATGFFARADQLSPNNARVKAGLAAALVRSENPYDAIPMFAEAERAGAMDPMLSSDRGLAYDLVGDNATAQRYYRMALAAGTNDEVLRRLAISQAISGDRAGMETTLTPLLQRQDRGAWRARAFALAILNRPDDAIAIARDTMPADLANGIAPYLRYMPQLTHAQQAAAANLGHFPRAAEIGRDDPRVALYAAPKRVATADGALVPKGEPLGRSSRAARTEPRRPEPPVFPTAVTPIPQPRSMLPAPLPAAQPAPLAPSRPVVAARAVPVVQAPSVPPTRIASAATPPTLQSGSTARFDLARVAVAASSAPSAAAPAPVAAAPRPAAIVAPPAPAPIAPAHTAKPRRVADAFADLAMPLPTAVPTAGAVDVRKITPTRRKPPEPPKPAHPSRIWVQVGTGRDKAALGFTWRGLAKENPELFRGKTPSLTDWGRANRLLAGPFQTEAAADSYLAKLKKAGVDAFVWTSPAGQVVDDLPGK